MLTRKFEVWFILSLNIKQLQYKDTNHTQKNTILFFYHFFDSNPLKLNLITHKFYLIIFIKTYYEKYIATYRSKSFSKVY